MVGWHHRLNGYEFEQTQGDSEGQGSLVCCSPWICRVGNNLATELNVFLALAQLFVTLKDYLGATAKPLLCNPVCELSVV